MYGHIEVTLPNGDVVTSSINPLELFTEDRCIAFAWQQGSPLAKYRIVELETEDIVGEVVANF